MDPTPPPPIRLFLPVICYNHLCHTAFMFSLMRLVLLLKNHGVPATLFPITFDSLVSRARNAAVAHFMSGDYTHLMFIDADIEFSPEDVLKLLATQQPVVSAAYPQKWLHLGKIGQVFSRTPVPENPLELCCVHSVHLEPPSPQSPLLPGLLPATYCTTGFLMIQRPVIERMFQAYPERKYINDVDGYMGADSNMFYNLFTVEIHPETRRYESEDYGFSRLWKNIGGQIYILTDVSLKHYGWYGYAGNLHRSQTNESFS
jgi:hypothetical protein